jgi:hypothetical protein
MNNPPGKNIYNIIGLGGTWEDDKVDKDHDGNLNGSKCNSDSD